MKKTLAGRDVQDIVKVGVAGVVILWVYISYLLVPIGRQAIEVGKQTQQARQRLKSLQSVVANENSVKVQYAQMDEVVSSLRKAMPAEEELPAVIDFISDLAAKTDVKIQTIFPQRANNTQQQQIQMLPDRVVKPEEPPVYVAIPIQIDALAGFHELGTFLSLVETGDKPTQVVSLRISANPKEPRRHQVNLVIRSYFAVSMDTETTKHAAASLRPNS